MNTTRTLLLSLAVAASLAAYGTPTAPAVAAPAAIAAVSGTYRLDPDHTNVLVQWTHFGFSQPSADFHIDAGTLVFDATDAGKSSVDVTLPMAAIDTFVPALDEHLKKADFFDVARFPQARFRSTGVKPAGGNKFIVTGVLTIKDVSKPVTLDVTLNGAGKHGMTGQQAIGFSATATLKRSDFGVGAFAPAVSDEVRLRITTEGSLPAVAGKE